MTSCGTFQTNVQTTVQTHRHLPPAMLCTCQSQLEQTCGTVHRGGRSIEARTMWQMTLVTSHFVFYFKLFCGVRGCDL